MDMVTLANRLLAGPYWKDKKQGIVVIYKDGTKDWFDPVSETKIEDDNLTITIENGNEYSINLENIQFVSFYDV